MTCILNIEINKVIDLGLTRQILNNSEGFEPLMAYEIKNALAGACKHFERIDWSKE